MKLLRLIVHDAAMTAQDRDGRPERGRAASPSARDPAGGVEPGQAPRAPEAVAACRGTSLLSAVGHPLLRRLVEHVAQHYAEPLLLKQLAPACGLSCAYASDLFSKTMEFPFKQYLTALRMRKADELLRGGRLSVKEVSHACGYRSFGPFRRAFRRWRGLAPDRVRRGPATF